MFSTTLLLESDSQVLSAALELLMMHLAVESRVAKEGSEPLWFILLLHRRLLTALTKVLVVLVYHS